MLLANAPTQAESLLLSQEQEESGIALDINSGKTEAMCFKQEEAISTLSSQPLKLVEQFTYLGSDEKIRRVKVQFAIDR